MPSIDKHFEHEAIERKAIITLLEIDDLPLKTDVMVNVPGLDFASAWEHASNHTLDGQTIYLISRADLIKAKRAAGRWQDLEDVKALEATAENGTTGRGATSD